MKADDPVFRILQATSTLQQTREFLRERGLPFTAGSWESLIAGRLVPALKRGLTRSDLLRHLAESEEFGRQHVFLYRRKGAKRATLPSPSQVKAWLKGTPDEGIDEKPRVLEYPDTPTFSEVRYDDDGSLIVKLVETRLLVEFIGERDTDGGFVREYSRKPIRSVNVIRAEPDGTVEVRLYSHRSQGASYRDDLPAVWGMLSGLLKEELYEAWPLTIAKQELWSQRKKLKGVIRFSKSTLRDVRGTVMDCATGAATADLYADDAADEGIRVFQEKGDAYCDRHNVWWLRQARTGVPSKDLHVLLAGAPNEFALTMQCSRSDYEYVLGELRRFNS